MKKKTVKNLIMVAVILIIAAAGILGVGYIRGWFDPADGTQAVMQTPRGVIDLIRAGVSCPVESATVLRSGDKLSCQNGATGEITFGDSKLILGEKAILKIINPATDHFQAELISGELFAHCGSSAEIILDKSFVTVRQATAIIHARSGAQSVSVLRGTVMDTAAGQMLSIVDHKTSISTLHIESLNDFAISQIRALNQSSLCFSISELDALAKQRQQAIQEMIDTQTGVNDPDDVTEPMMPPVETEPATEPNTQPADTTSPDITEQVTPLPKPTEEPTEDPTDAPTEPATSPTPDHSCTIAIYCKTILNNMDALEPGKAEFVPSDGIILYPVTVHFSEGETVFDILKRVCSITGIQLEYSWTPLYNSYYVEGINNLYEFDCGIESGWMYKVNGWFPNYGCSSYTLKDGDVIVWAYTCTGLGTDVGAPRME